MVFIRASAVLKKNQGGGMWREEESTASCVRGEGRKKLRKERERKERKGKNKSVPTSRKRMKELGELLRKAEKQSTQK